MKALIGVVLCAALGGAVFGQSLGQAEEDLSAFLGGLGADILSQLQQSALMGDGPGDASIGDFPHFYFSMGAGAVLGNGIGKIVDDPGAFQVLNVAQIIDLALQTMNNATVADLYARSRTFFPMPDARLALGIGIAGGVELTGQVAWWPQSLTSAIAGAGPTASFLNAGVRIRKRLLGDEGGLPALSIGAGYVYSSFALGYDLSSFGTITVSPASFDFASSSVSMGATLHTTGIDVAVSKRLAFFVPYLRLSGWYQWGSFDGALTDLATTISTTSVLNPSAHAEARGASFLVGAGFGLKLGGLGLSIGGSYNPRSNFPSVSVSLSGQR